jgi:microcystin-dependent protein
MEPFVGEIKLVGFDFAPDGWAACDGQLVSTSSYPDLFALLGTTYGGDGRSTFGLPNLQGRIPMHEGQGHTLAEQGGEAQHALTTSEMPVHTHVAYGVAASAQPGTPPSSDVMLAHSGGKLLYGAAADLQPMSSLATGSTGLSEPHSNLQPYLPVQFVICLRGISPTLAAKED